MEIIKTQIEDIIKFPFEDKDWLNTFGIYIAIGFLTTLIIIIVFSLVIITGSIIGTMFLPTMFTIVVLNIAFLTNLYLQGYILEMINNIRVGKKREKPEHKNTKTKLKLGLTRFIISLGPILLGLIFLGISIALITYGVLIIQEATSMIGILIIIIGSLKALFSILLIIFITTMVIPSMLYLYLETNSITKSYCFKNIFLIIKHMWKEFLIVYAFTILISIIISALGQMPCIGIFILIGGTAYTTFVMGFLIGKIFIEIDKLKLFKG